MALSMTIQTQYGLSVADAYHRVEGFELLSKARARFRLRAYANASMAAIADTAYVFDYDLNGPGPLAQAYLHLKSLPEFAGATDC